MDKLNFFNLKQRLRLLTQTFVVMLFLSLGSNCVYAEVSENKSSNSTLRIAIIDKNWQLKSISKSGKILFEQGNEPGERVVTLLFDSACKVSGRSVINRYFGQCEFGDNDTINWKDPGFGMTMMAGPPEDMDAEQLYLKNLKQTTKIKLKESSLELHSDDGEISLVFELTPDR